MTPPPLPPDLDPETRRALAVGLYNRVWQLLDTDDRTVEQDDEMVDAAHASRYHWGHIGTAQNYAVGEWQLSRVYSVLGRGEPALHHARRCLALTEENALPAWTLGSAFEAMARAAAVAGDPAAASWRAKAVAQLDQIEDPDDREVVARDVATLPE
jgi:hypothetical protein